MLRDSPELAGETITIDRLDPYDAKDGTNGRAGMLNRILYLPCERGSFLSKIYHELGHLVILVLDEQGVDVPI